MKKFTFWQQKKIRFKMQSMKKILILLLMFSISCNKDSSNPAPTGTGTETETTTPEVRPPNTTPTPAPTPTYPTPTPPAPTPVPTTPTIPSTTQTWTEEFMDMVNDHRASIGLRALIHDDQMGDIARTHSQNMASGAVAFGHTGFSARCSASKSALGGGNWCGENVAAGQTSPKSAFTSWMNSSGHRANIEKSSATHTGFGFAKSSSGKYYWTQIFIQL